MRHRLTNRKNMNKWIENKGYEELTKNIGSIYNKAKQNVISAVNVEMLNTYWEIGRYL